MRRPSKRIGLAIVGGGRVGRFRGEIAARHPAVEWIGVAEILPDRGRPLGEAIDANFVTADFRELLARPEVTGVIVATDEHAHVEPIMLSVA